MEKSSYVTDVTCQPGTQFGFSEEADGFTRITNPTRFAIARGVVTLMMIAAGGFIIKKMKKE